MFAVVVTRARERARVRVERRRAKMVAFRHFKYEILDTHTRTCARARSQTAADISLKAASHAAADGTTHGGKNCGCTRECARIFGRLSGGDGGGCILATTSG